MIVDDEVLSRNQIKSDLINIGIDENNLCTAETGIKALELAPNFKPDILLTDINMPKMLGTDLAKEILKLFPQCKIIFLSGYSDNEYLIAAINLSVVDYLEKPLDTDELESAIKKAYDLIYKEHNLSSADELKRSNNDYDFLDKLFKHKSQLCAESLNILKPSNTTGYVVAIVSPISEFSASIINCIKLYADKNNIKFMFRQKSNSSIEILFYGNFLLLNEKVNNILNSFLSDIKNGELFKCAVGSFEKKADSIFLTYENAVCTLDKCFFYSPNTLVYYTDTKAEKPVDVSEFIKQMNTHLSNERLDMARSVAEDIYMLFKENHLTLSSNVKKVYYNLFETIHSFFKKNFFNYSDEYNLYTDTFNIYESNFLDDLNNHLKSSLDKVEILIKNANFNRISKKAMAYIEENYSNANLSVLDIAQHCEVNSTYLCSKFKSDTSQTINHYINHIRIEKSKQLILSSNASIAEISQKCGFNNSKYFCKVFQKYTSLTPTNFRKKYKK